MSKQIDFDSDDDMEDVPSQFETSIPTLGSQFDTDKFHPNQTLTHQSHRPQYDPTKHTKTQTSDVFLQKTELYMASRLTKFKNIKQQQDHRVMADCTFKPQINKSASRSPRNVKQFIESQQQHLNKIKQKKEWLKQRLEEERKKNMTFSPLINKTKNEKNKENVHSRLYKLKDKDTKSSRFQECFTHIPKITKKGENLVREMPVNELLYLDAKRRAQRYYDPVESETSNVEKHYLHDKYVAQKFLKDYKAALESTQLMEKMTFSEDDLISILKELGYVRHSSSDKGSLAIEERHLLHDCFCYLSKYGVTQINLYVFLLALSGIYNVDLNNDQITSALVIEEGEGKALHHRFDPLFRNKLFSETLKKSKKCTEETPMRPSLSPQNRQMASRYRGKMIDRTNTIFEQNNIAIKLPENGLSHEDLLVIYSLGKNLQKERMRQTKSREKDPECTFQPNADRYPQEFISSQMGSDKCKQLYENAKIRQEENRLPTFRSFDNKRGDSCFSRQSLSPIKKSHSKTPTKSVMDVSSYLQIKDVDKTLSRMVMGRKQRQQKRQLQERGEPSSKKYQKQQLQTFDPTFQQQQNQLLLDADILVNNIKKKIYIYKQDEDRIDQVVDQFAEECDLDPCSRDMLYQRLVEAVQTLRIEKGRS